MRKKVVLPKSGEDTIVTPSITADQMVIVMKDGKVTGAVVRAFRQDNNNWYHYTTDCYIGTPASKQTICERLIAQGYELFIDE